MLNLVKYLCILMLRMVMLPPKSAVLRLGSALVYKMFQQFVPFAFRCPVI
jgi:hypothetical protein